MKIGDEGLDEGKAMKIRDGGLDDEDEPRTVGKVESRWGREKKNEKERGRKKRSLREKQWKRKKEKIFFKRKRREKFIKIKFFFLALVKSL